MSFARTMDLLRAIEAELPHAHRAMVQEVRENVSKYGSESVLKDIVKGAKDTSKDVADGLAEIQKEVGTLPEKVADEVLSRLPEAAECGALLQPPAPAPEPAQTGLQPIIATLRTPTGILLLLVILALLAALGVDVRGILGDLLRSAP